MRQLLAGLCFLLSAPLAAVEIPQPLTLLGEYPVEGMPAGNLSGLTRCDGAWQAISDREDDRLYQLTPGAQSWQASAEIFDAARPPVSAQPWGMRVRTQIIGWFRPGKLDFESISCDNQGNRYLLSEAHTAVLKLSPEGDSQWLPLPANLLRQARATGLLLNYNAQLEGLVIEPSGERLWLAAERERRGLILAHQNSNKLLCRGACVRLSESGQRHSPLEANSDKRYPRDFSDLALFNGKLFSLQRLEQQICRRDTLSGAQEKCWSLAAIASEADRRYNDARGNAEALWLDKDGAWIGLDNNGKTRADGEQRPLIWHVAAPKGGWLAP